MTRREAIMMTNNNPTELADSHSGQHGDFSVFWSFYFPPSNHQYAPGWYWCSFTDTDAIGPFETSQAAFGDYKDYVDEEISQPYYTEPAKYGL